MKISVLFCQYVKYFRTIVLPSLTTEYSLVWSNKLSTWHMIKIEKFWVLNCYRNKSLYMTGENGSILFILIFNKQVSSQPSSVDWWLYSVLSKTITTATTFIKLCCEQIYTYMLFKMFAVHASVSFQIAILSYLKLLIFAKICMNSKAKNEKFCKNLGQFKNFLFICNLTITNCIIKQIEI